MEKMIDAHIHLDLYEKVEMKEIIENSAFLEALISVSFHLESCKTNLLLSEKYDKVKPAFGFHPEQPLPNENEIEKLVCWMNDHKREMTAVGEVGLLIICEVNRKLHHTNSDSISNFWNSLLNWRKSGKNRLFCMLYMTMRQWPVICLKSIR